MSEIKFTPGPWQWWTSNSWRRLTAHNLPGRGYGQEGDVLCPIVARDGHPDLVVKMADATLIAAAPDLYEALELVVGSLKFDREDAVSREVMKRINAALAKARGEVQ